MTGAAILLAAGLAALAFAGGPVTQRRSMLAPFLIGGGATAAAVGLLLLGSAPE
jgi:hypothetical protein